MWGCGPYICAMEHIHSVKMDLMVLAIRSPEDLLSHQQLVVLLRDGFRNLHLRRFCDLSMRVDPTIAHSSAAQYAARVSLDPLCQLLL